MGIQCQTDQCFLQKKLFLLTYHTCKNGYKYIFSLYYYSKILKPTQWADIRNITAFKMHLFRSIVILQFYLFGLNYNQFFNSSKNTDMKK